MATSRLRTSLLNPSNSPFLNPVIGLRRSFSFYRLSTTGNDVYFPWSSCLLISCHFFPPTKAWTCVGFFVLFFAHTLSSLRRRDNAPPPSPPGEKTFPGHNPGGTVSFHLQLARESWLELQLLDWGRFQNIMSVLLICSETLHQRYLTKNDKKPTLPLN